MTLSTAFGSVSQVSPIESKASSPLTARCPPIIHGPPPSPWISLIPSKHQSLFVGIHCPWSSFRTRVLRRTKTFGCRSQDWCPTPGHVTRHYRHCILVFSTVAGATTTWAFFRLWTDASANSRDCVAARCALAGSVGQRQVALPVAP
jgi:hypothetical protein